MLPKGKADVPGILLGYPALDSPGFGLGWKPVEKHHYFAEMDIHMPRAELKKRAAHFSDLKAWYEDRKEPGALYPDQVNRLTEAVRGAEVLASEVCASLVGGDFHSRAE